MVHSEAGTAPGDRGGGDEHLAAGGAYAAERLPGFRGRHASPGGLAAVGRFVEVGLFDSDLLPVNVELFRNEHGKLGLDALAHFGSAGFDGDGSVGGDLDESGGLQVSALLAPAPGPAGCRGGE